MLNQLVCYVAMQCLVWLCALWSAMHTCLCGWRSSPLVLLYMCVVPSLSLLYNVLLIVLYKSFVNHSLCSLFTLCFVLCCTLFIVCIAEQFYRPGIFLGHMTCTMIIVYSHLLFYFTTVTLHLCMVHYFGVHVLWSFNWELVTVLFLDQLRPGKVHL